MFFCGSEVDSIAEVLEDENLVAAWDYIEDYRPSKDNLSKSNIDNLAATRWLAEGTGLARCSFWHVDCAEDSFKVCARGVNRPTPGKEKQSTDS